MDGVSRGIPLVVSNRLLHSTRALREARLKELSRRGGYRERAVCSGVQNRSPSFTGPVYGRAGGKRFLVFKSAQAVLATSPGRCPVNRMSRLPGGREPVPKRPFLVEG